MGGRTSISAGKQPAQWAPGLRIGLLGGSFNPAHEGHLHLSLMCLSALSLDTVWWLVSPQNPLKDETGMAPFHARFASAKAQASDARIHVSDIENELGTRYTADTLDALRARFSDLHFVWLMGADNLIQFPKWQRWRDIIATMPIAIYPRPGYTQEAKHSPLARAFPSHTLDAASPPSPPALTPPQLFFIDGPENNLSATALRASGHWPQPGTEPEK